VITDAGLKRQVLRSLLRTGFRYTENDCATALANVIERVRDEDVLLVAEVFEEEPGPTLWLDGAGVLRGRRVPSAVAAAISRVAAAILILDPRQLRELSSYRGLEAHYSDASTVQLRHYPTAVRVDAPTPAGPLEVTPAGSGIEVVFVADVRGFSVRYQQGLYNAEITVRLADGTERAFAGSSFFPESATLAVLAPHPIASVVFRSQGTLSIQEFVFYATASHARRFAAV
jgi:hypothetical protein